MRVWRVAFGCNITQPTVQIQRPGHEPKQVTATFLYLPFSPITSSFRDTERDGRTDTVDSDDNRVIVVIRNRLCVTRYSTNTHTHTHSSNALNMFIATCIMIYTHPLRHTFSTMDGAFSIDREREKISSSERSPYLRHFGR